MKAQLRDGTTFDDVRDQDALQIAAVRTFDHDKIWTNPNMKIPLETAHLYIYERGDNPQEYESLCVKHDEIKAVDRSAPVEPAELDPSMIEYLCETPITDWNNVSEDFVTASIKDPIKKKCFNLYLQTKPEEQERRKIKEFMIE